MTPVYLQAKKNDSPFVSDEDDGAQHASSSLKSRIFQNKASSKRKVNPPLHIASHALSPVLTDVLFHHTATSLCPDLPFSATLRADLAAPTTSLTLLI